MPNAVRINGVEVIEGLCHYDALLTYMEREGLTDDQTDAMFDAGQIEFGNTYLDRKVCDVEKRLVFSPDMGIRRRLYRSVDAVKSNA